MNFIWVTDIEYNKRVINANMILSMRKEQETTMIRFNFVFGTAVANLQVTDTIPEILNNIRISNHG